MAPSTTEPAMKPNAKALDPFIARKAEIDAMLARLAALSDDHFRYAPDEINGAMSARSATTPRC